MKKKIFLIDFDITISKNDSTDTLMGKHNPKKHIEMKTDYRNGKLTMREYLKDAIESLNITKEEFIETLKLVKIDESFLNFFNSENKFKIVSAGTKLNIIGSLRHYGINIDEKDVISNDIFFEGNKIKVTNPYLDAEKYYGVDKKEIVEKYQREGYEVWFLGDGPSDYRAMEVADKVLVRSGTRAVKFCEENKIEFKEFNDFNEILNDLEKEE